MAMVATPTTAANVFNLRSAFSRFVRSFTAVLFVLMVPLTYYTVVVSCYGPSLLAGNPGSSLSVLLPFHLLLAMVLWSYFSVVFTDPGGVPANWMPSMELQNVINIGDQGISSTTADQLSNQIVSYCPTCNTPRPPRCHHCSICERCVLKMDHHSAVNANCIGALNHKFFILFLLYGFLEASLGGVASLYHLYFGEVFDHPSGPRFPFLIINISGFNLAFALYALFMLVVHLSLVAENTTSMEEMTRSSYDMGMRMNFEQVFGTNKKYWLIPWYSAEDCKKLLDLQTEVGILLGGDV